MSIYKVFPRWMQEFKRFLPLKSQFYFYGNVYDSFYLPTNLQPQPEKADLGWAKFDTIEKFLVDVFLKSEGYEIICTYDWIDGLKGLAEGPDWKKSNISRFIKSPLVLADDSIYNLPLGQIEKNLSDTLTFFRILMNNHEKLSAGIIRFASRFVADPNHLEMEERKEFIKIVKAAQEARFFKAKDGKRNILIFICDKLNDIPSWVLIDNPLTKGIQIEKPNRYERLQFFQVQKTGFYQVGDSLKTDEIEQIFPDLTDGLTNRELENLITISNREKIHVNNLRQIIDLFKYGTRENFWEELNEERIKNAESQLKKRVLGQEHAIQRSLQIVRRANLGLHTIDQIRPKNKPKGVLFFAGPTGVGKTELAKSLAELIFSDEDAVIRFDMSEYNDSNSDVKLIGSPPGYVGYEEGGQLTNRIRQKPFSIILFDEIEKAHRIVFDKFLQILDDGRLTDGKGETVYFSETLIIFTSNLGVIKETETGQQIENIQVDSDNYEQMSKKIMDEIKYFFTKKLNRPEILNRFGDNFVVFDFIREPIDREILVKNLNIIKANLKKQKNCNFEFDDLFIDAFREKHIKPNLNMGGRGILNQIEKHIKNGITSFMFQQHQTENLHFRALIDLSDNQVKFECIGN